MPEILSSIRIKPEVPFESIGSAEYYECLERKGVVFNSDNPDETFELSNRLNDDGEIKEVVYRIYDTGEYLELLKLTGLDMVQEIHMPIDGCFQAILTPICFKYLEHAHSFKLGFYESGERLVRLRWGFTDNCFLDWFSEWIYR